MRRALFFGMILLIINSCGVLRPKPTSTISVSNSKELLKQTQRTQPTWETLDLRGSLTARQGDISQRITITVRISANELIWLNAAVIVPLGRAKLTKVELPFTNKLEKPFLKGTFRQSKKRLVSRLVIRKLKTACGGFP